MHRPNDSRNDLEVCSGTNYDTGKVGPRNLTSIDWKPPERDMVKINYDAPFNRQQFRSVSGLIA